ncbi:MAG TPA: hypothetical protein PK674_01665 [Candidatus Absconditabacterales bacterium]|nr:hypothetical protein [Candidatus Absconditabacterales bacterium]HPK28104.1 hypothetical protein [Candidatus Absconditabacterales bacterium]
MKTKSVVARDVQRILKKSLKRIILTSIFLSFLFYLLNIFVGFSLKIENIGEFVTSKVGIYFYINEENKGSDDIFKRILSIKDELNRHGIKAEFSSKEDAFNYLETRVPAITKNFDKFGIENPLTSTLYVMFRNQQEYNIMKDIIVKNKDLILNIKDVDKGATLVQQENRSLKIIKVMNIIKFSFYFIVVMLGIIILSFTQHLLRHFFNNFYEEIEIKKLLGAKTKDVNMGFIITLLLSITLGFIIGFILTCITLGILNKNLLALNLDLSLCSIAPRLLLLYILFSLIAIILGYRMLKQKAKKF